MADITGTTTGATRYLLDMVRSNLEGDPVGIYSICSANQFVLQAGMLQAMADQSMICIESTSNQVNQFGGYIGMTPEHFSRFVRSVASEAGLPQERIILGGDHLGPHVWQNEPADSAMDKACKLVSFCVLAGYTKIHLDASMRCADDPGGSNTPLNEQVATERTADLCAAAERAYAHVPVGSPAPVYVIGTEVPAPGGEQAADCAIRVTSPEDVERTICLARDAFLSRGLESAWHRVIAVVVQPGVEFGDATVFDYDRTKARTLSSYVEKSLPLVFEAHSTDYQLPEALRQMVEDHFAILKVGPWLTFAFREAVFALAMIEEELISASKGLQLSKIRQVLEEIMVGNPQHWKKYYRGDEAHLRYARKYSYSDRARYYWPEPHLREALELLLRNVSRNPIPLTLLSQYLPAQYEAVRRGMIPNEATHLIQNRIREVMAIYSHACRLTQGLRIRER